MRGLAGIGLLSLGLWLGVAFAEVPQGDFYARIRSNDAPIGGRLSIYAYMLDSLDAVVTMPGPGRVLAMSFRESNGNDAFLIPGDLVLEGYRRQKWSRGFAPLGDKRLPGLLPKDENRWALWWVPHGSDSLVWDSEEELTVRYGFSGAGFFPLEEKDTRKTLSALPWEDIRNAVLDPARPTAAILVPPNPAAFDELPRVKTEKTPEYPETALMFDFEGSVHVVALVDVDGSVKDAFVLHSTAPHQLNVAALTSVMDWRFRPGKKGGKKVSGEFVIPVHFTLGSAR